MKSCTLSLFSFPDIFLCAASEIWLNWVLVIVANNVSVTGLRLALHHIIISQSTPSPPPSNVYIMAASSYIIYTQTFSFAFNANGGELWVGGWVLCVRLAYDFRFDIEIRDEFNVFLCEALLITSIQEHKRLLCRRIYFNPLSLPHPHYNVDFTVNSYAVIRLQYTPSSVFICALRIIFDFCCVREWVKFWMPENGVGIKRNTSNIIITSSQFSSCYYFRVWRNFHCLNIYLTFFTLPNSTAHPNRTSFLFPSSYFPFPFGLKAKL